MSLDLNLFSILGMGGMMAPTHSRDDGDEERHNSHYEEPPRHESAWERPITLGQLIISMLGLVAAFAGIFFNEARNNQNEKLALERRITILEQRQDAVLNTHLPQLRGDVAALRQVDNDRTGQLNSMNEREQQRWIQFLEYAARNPGIRDKGVR